MKLNASAPLHLTYCSNIHPGESWAEVRENLERYLPSIKTALAPNAPFGVGLRLSAEAAYELADPETLAAFKSFLEAQDLYVFTINGFPYGRFHGTRVKADVFLPDWRDPERLRYTDCLARILAELLPVEPELIGSISTVPGAYKEVLASGAEIEEIAANLRKAAARLAALRRDTGKTLALALEPEPCCLIETVAEAVTFFEEHLLTATALEAFAELADLAPGEAEETLRRHLGICLDLCHAAVEFEDPKECLETLRSAGLQVPKIQVSAGLRFRPVTSETIDLLRPFDDQVYLHQVIERGAGGELARFTDLNAAFATGDGEDGREWRVHFHVPLFLEDLGRFTTTQGFTRAVLEAHRASPLTTHLEVETYTWNVLPEAYRSGDIVSATVRELQWVRDQLGA